MAAPPLCLSFCASEQIRSVTLRDFVHGFHLTMFDCALLDPELV